MAAYIALLRKDAESDYGVDFPDFPGCVTAGISLEDARRMATEALLFHADGLREDGAELPPPATLDAVMSDPHNAHAVAFLVDLPRRTSLSVRVNIMLPKDILDAIDRISGNRSRFLADAAREKLNS